MDKETCDPVYDMPCADCSKSYIGETQWKFITRKGEHQKAVARRQGEKSALADHVIKTNHDIAWDEATILRTNNNWHQRKILEAREINCAKDPLNQEDGALLPKDYLHLTLANKKKWHISWILISVLFISVFLHKICSFTVPEEGPSMRSKRRKHFYCT